MSEIQRLESYFSKILENRGACSSRVHRHGETHQTVRLANQTKYFKLLSGRVFYEEMESELQPWRGLLDGDLVIQHKILTISQ